MNLEAFLEALFLFLTENPKKINFRMLDLRNVEKIHNPQISEF